MSVSPFRIGQQVVIAHDLKGFAGTKGTVVDTERRDDFTLIDRGNSLVLLDIEDRFLLPVEHT